MPVSQRQGAAPHRQTGDKLASLRAGLPQLQQVPFTDLHIPEPASGADTATDRQQLGIALSR